MQNRCQLFLTLAFGLLKACYEKRLDKSDKKLIYRPLTRLRLFVGHSIG